MPYRDGPGGVPEVLLITSRGTRRWVIPKGNRVRGLSAHLAAAHEAFEEAGVSGVPAASAIGSYGYDKLRRDGTSRPARVDVFPLAVEARSKDWPERDQRDSRWFSLRDAAEAVEEPELKAIIAAFRSPPDEFAGGIRRWARRLLKRGG